MDFSVQQRRGAAELATRGNAFIGEKINPNHRRALIVGGQFIIPIHYPRRELHIFKSRLNGFPFAGNREIVLQDGQRGD